MDKDKNYIPASLPFAFLMGLLKLCCSKYSDWRHLIENGSVREDWRVRKKLEPLDVEEGRKERDFFG